MEPEVFVDILSGALFLVIKLVSAIVVPGLIIGLVVAVFQALPLATTLREADGSGFVVLHGGLPGEHSHHPHLAQIAKIDRVCTIRSNF